MMTPKHYMVAVSLASLASLASGYDKFVVDRTVWGQVPNICASVESGEKTRNGASIIADMCTSLNDHQLWTTHETNDTVMILWRNDEKCWTKDRNDLVLWDCGDKDKEQEFKVFVHEEIYTLYQYALASDTSKCIESVTDRHGKTYFEFKDCDTEYSQDSTQYFEKVIDEATPTPTVPAHDIKGYAMINWYYPHEPQYNSNEKHYCIDIEEKQKHKSVDFNVIGNDCNVTEDYDPWAWADDGDFWAGKKIKSLACGIYRARPV